jgi:hypothetical protein
MEKIYCAEWEKGGKIMMMMNKALFGLSGKIVRNVYFSITNNKGYV